jgi:hypothetical protein
MPKQPRWVDGFGVLDYGFEVSAAGSRADTSEAGANRLASRVPGVCAAWREFLDSIWIRGRTGGVC